MCFSPEASFTAALVLGATGIVTLKNSSSPSQFFLAAIPLLFAIQQLAEGIVWLHILYHLGSDAFFLNAQRAFLIFAFLVWPIWIPLSFAALEQIPWRRFLLYLNLACGVVLCVLNLSYAMQQDISVEVVNHSLHYQGYIFSQTVIYTLIVLFPFFLSSLKNLWIFGILIAIAYVVAEYFYQTTFVSVWCFFAAIASLCVYKILKDNYHQKKY